LIALVDTIPFHDGDIEALYYLQAQSGGAQSYSVFFPVRYWPYRFTVLMFGAHLGTMRLLSVCAFAAGAYLASRIGVELVGEKKGRWGAVLFASNPWAFVYMGRIMPEPWLMLGVLGCVYTAMRGKGLWAWPFFFALAVFSKSVGILAISSLVFLDKRRVKYAFVLSAFLVMGALFAWPMVTFAYQKFMARGSIEVPYDLFNVLTVSLGIGAAGAAWFGLAHENWRGWVVMAPWGAYLVWDARLNHAYYALPLIGLLAVFSVIWLSRHYRDRIMITIVSGFFVCVAVIFAGDGIDNRVRVIDSLPDGVEVSTSKQLAKRLAPFAGDRRLITDGTAQEYGIEETVPDGCNVLGSRSYFGKELFGFRCLNV
jgi:hypothetical protein